MPAILIGLVMLLGVGGTVAVSDSAAPGDVLFPVDRAVEKIQLVLARKSNEASLKAKFAEERLQEVSDILAEDDNDEMDDSDEDNNDDDAMSGTSTDDSINDRKKVDVEAGLSFAIDLISELEDSDKYVELSDRLASLLENLPEGTELSIKVSDSGNSFLKVRSEEDSNRFDFEVKENEGKTIIKTRDGENKVEVQIEDGKFEIEVKSDNRGQGSMNSGRDDEDDDADEDKMDDSGDDKDEMDDSDNDELDEVKGNVSSVNVLTGEITLTDGTKFIINSTTAVEMDDNLTDLASVSDAIDKEVKTEADVYLDGDSWVASKVKFEVEDDEEDEMDDSDDN